MSQTTRRFTIDLEHSLSEIPRLATAVEAFLAESAVPDQTIAEVNLVLEELITNVITHGNVKSRDVHIRVEMEVDDTSISFSILDNGRAFNQLRIGEPDLEAGIEERPIGGLGVHLARRFTNSQRYERRDRLNVLHLVKRLD